MLISPCEAVSIQSSMVSCYDHEGPNVMYDFMNISNGTVKSGYPLNVTGKLNNAINISTSIGGWWNHTTPTAIYNFTWCAWVKANTTLGATMRTMEDSQSGPRIKIRLDDSGSNIFSIYDGVGVRSSNYSLTDYNWHLYCVVHDKQASSTFTFYVDGQNRTTTASADVSYQDRVVGITTSPADILDGFMDISSAYDGELNISQIALIYNSGSGRNCSQIYYSEIPPSISAANISYTNDSVANGTRTGYNYTGKINISINGTITNITWEWNHSNATLYDNSLNLLMNFDNDAAIGENAAKCVDISMFQNNATISGAIYNATGKYGRALFFDGVNDYAEIPSTKGLMLNNTFTISAWIYRMQDNAIFERIISNSDSGGGFDWYLQINNDDTLGGGFAKPDASSINVNSVGIYTVPLNTWVYATVSKNLTALTLYVNGNYITNVSAVADVRQDAGWNVQLGRLGASGSWTYSYKGLLDDVTIYNESMSHAEIQQSYHTDIVKYSTGKFYLYANVSNQTGTTVYRYKAHAKDVTDWNSTISRDIYLNQDVYPPAVAMISPNISVNNSHFNTNIDIIFSTDENSSCTMYNMSWSLNYSNSTYYVYKTNTNLSEGVYNITIICNDTLNNSGPYILNFTIDTIIPSTTWINPSFDNSSVFLYTTTENMQISLNDINLFGYNVSVYDSLNRIMYNDYMTGIVTTGETLAFSMILNITGTWKINLEVTDDHTAANIPDYVYVLRNNKLEFVFDKAWNESSNVTIEYIGKYPTEDVRISKLYDRYSFNYDFKLMEDALLPEITHKYRVSCAGMTYRTQSVYPGHFVCYDTKTWLDFVSTRTAKYSVKRTGNDAYEITIKDIPTSSVSFNSIGSLNMLNESVRFEVASSMPASVDLTSFDITTTSNVLIMFVIALCWLGCLMLGWFFRSFAFISIGFFFGLVLGFMMFDIHAMITIMMFLLNTTLLLSFSAASRRR